MGGTNPFQGTVGDFGKQSGQAIHDTGGMIGNLVNPSSTAPAAQAAPPPPTLADSSSANLAKQFDIERQMRASSTLFTSGQGLTDQPSTASRVLIGT